MPKRHAQPEPIDICDTGKSAEVSAVDAATAALQKAAAAVKNSRPTSGELLPSNSSNVYPATPSTLAQKRKLDEKNVKAAKFRLEDYGDSGSSGDDDSVMSQAQSDQIDFDLSNMGDDGNQEDDRTESEMEDKSEEEEAMRRMRRAVRVSRRVGGPQRIAQDSESEFSGSYNPDMDSDDDDEDSFELNEDDEEFDEEGEWDDEEEEGGSMPDSDDIDDDDDGDDDEEDSTGDFVTVDFGVYDMKPSNVDGVMHLMDQFCPDKMNEVDRDALGEALAENPYTYVIQVNNDNNNNSTTTNSGAEEDGAEEEFYGLASILDVAHGVNTHPKAFRSLYQLLKTSTWRTAAPGMPPTDILVDLEDDGDDADEEDVKGKPTGKKATKGGSKSAKEGLAKCVLLMAEYIRNVPMELTIQVLEDLVSRLDANKQNGSEEEEVEEGKNAKAVQATKPCMIAVLAKIQRAVEAPVTLDPASSMKEEADKKPSKKGGKSSGASGEDPAEGFSMDKYIFWREEDSVLFEFRDKRVATLVYKCRPQYDNQPEQDIPLSVLFVMQFGAMRQAIDEMKKRATTRTDVVRYN